jgi:phage terminase small subunit
MSIARNAIRLLALLASELGTLCGYMPAYRFRPDLMSIARNAIRLLALLASELGTLYGYMPAHPSSSNPELRSEYDRAREHFFT